MTRRELLLPRPLHEKFVDCFPNLGPTDRTRYAFEWAAAFDPTLKRVGPGEYQPVMLRGDVPDDLARAVTRRAARLGMPVAELVRQAIAWRLENAEG